MSPSIINTKDDDGMGWVRLVKDGRRGGKFGPAWLGLAGVGVIVRLGWVKLRLG